MSQMCSFRCESRLHAGQANISTDSSLRYAITARNNNLLLSDQCHILQDTKFQRRRARHHRNRSALCIGVYNGLFTGLHDRYPALQKRNFFSHCSHSSSSWGECTKWKPLSFQCCTVNGGVSSNNSAKSSVFTIACYWRSSRFGRPFTELVFWWLLTILLTVEWWCDPRVVQSSLTTLQLIACQ